MKNLFKLSLCVLMLATLSFTTVPEHSFIGTYGVSKNDPSHIELKLNSDHTFSYQDFTIPSKKINVVGSWELKGKYVILNSKDSNISFHDKWKFDKNFEVAKSRKGMTFYLLGKK